MLPRVAGRVLTGPLGFLVAGVIDFAAMLVVHARRRAAQRRETVIPPS
jgi:hypothetical protein